MSEPADARRGALAVDSDARHDGRHRGDTRVRIQQVALELFAERGYDKTSLREIAERLDVTKAALYYHFKSKEDIVASLVEDYTGKLDELIAWGQRQPRTAQTRAEILDRYLRITAEMQPVFWMLHQNQAAAGSLAGPGTKGALFRERGRAVGELLTSGPDASLPERIRGLIAITGMSVSWMLFSGQAGHDELADAVLQVTTELVNGQAGHDQ